MADLSLHTLPTITPGILQRNGSTPDVHRPDDTQHEGECYFAAPHLFQILQTQHIEALFGHTRTLSAQPHTHTMLMTARIYSLTCVLTHLTSHSSATRPHASTHPFSLELVTTRTHTRLVMATQTRSVAAFHLFVPPPPPVSVS
jgi:hypothetical protein